MDLERQMDTAIIQGDFIKVKYLVYTQDIKVKKHHLQYAKTMQELCDYEFYEPILTFLYKEYIHIRKLNLFQRLFSINVEYI